MEDITLLEFIFNISHYIAEWISKITLIDFLLFVLLLVPFYIFKLIFRGRYYD